MEAVKLKYIPNLFAAISFLVIWLILSWLFMGRTIEFCKLTLITGYYPDFYFHVSNFVISYFIYAGIGYFWLMLGVNFKYIIALGIASVLANLIYELWIPILNTPDLIDAYFGLAGTFTAFVFLLLTFKFGLKPNTA